MNPCSICGAEDATHYCEMIEGVTFILHHRWDEPVSRLLLCDACNLALQNTQLFVPIELLDELLEVE
jgi:hypothetical protein